MYWQVPEAEVVRRAVAGAVEGAVRHTAMPAAASEVLRPPEPEAALSRSHAASLSEIRREHRQWRIVTLLGLAVTAVLAEVRRHRKH